MAERKKYEFSIVSYTQNLLRNEPINIGALLFDKSNQEITYKLIPDNSIKIRGLALDKYQKDLFKSTVKLLDFQLSSIDTATLSLDWFTKELPKQVKLSQPSLVITANKELIFKKIINQYVGQEYFKKMENVSVITPQVQALKIFEKNDLLGNKVKQNVRIRPQKNINMRLQIDFAYGIQNQLNLIDTAPTRITTADDWYTKMVLLSSRFNTDSKILLLSDLASEANQDNSISQMISDLKSQDQRIVSFDLGSPMELQNFNDFTKEIASDSIDELELNKLIAHQNHAVA